MAGRGADEARNGGHGRGRAWVGRVYAPLHGQLPVLSMTVSRVNLMERHRKRQG